ncbi:MAG: ArnT family glycosyltransferase [Tepidisphaeraceae bacterium]
MQLTSPALDELSHFYPTDEAESSVEAASLRLLPPLAAEESFASRALAMAIAVVFVAGYLCFILQYWAPAHPGVDQNGYLVGGKMLAHTGSMGFKPQDPLGFVGGMWVRNDSTGINYPKYPIGLPLLYACVLWVFGASGVAYAHLVSPVCTGVAVLGMYFIARQFVGVYAALLAMLVLAFSQITLLLADNPNSHASCLAFGVWGVFFLLRFWSTATLWRGLLGGFLIGYAATIRYTDGLLVLLIGMVAMSMVNWRDWRSYLRAAVPLVGWLVPIAYLVGFNLVTMHTPTGYDTTNESKPGSAFTFEHITQNWEKLIRQVHDAGLFFTLPLGLLGLVLAIRLCSRRAGFLWLWLIPGTLTYMAYYWAPERGVSYLRFFLTLLPPLVVGVGIAIQAVLSPSITRVQRIVNPLAGGLIVGVACTMSLYRALLGLEDGMETGQGMESQYRQQVNQAGLDRVVTSIVPSGSAVFSSANVLNDLQFVGDYACYNTEYFSVNYLQRLANQDEQIDPNDPDPLQPARRKFMLSQLAGKKADDLFNLQTDAITRNLQAGRRVFLVANAPTAEQFAKKYGRRDSVIACKVRGTFNELPRLREPDTNSTDPRQRMMLAALNRPGRVNGRPPRGGFGGHNVFREPVPQQWQIVELTAKPAQSTPTRRK